MQEGGPPASACSCAPLPPCPRDVTPAWADRQGAHPPPSASPSRHASRARRRPLPRVPSRRILALSLPAAPHPTFPVRHPHAGAVALGAGTPTDAGRARRRGPRGRGRQKRRRVPSRRDHQHRHSANGTGVVRTARHARDRDTARRERDGNVRALPRWGRAPLQRRMGARGPEAGRGLPRAWCARTAGRGGGAPSGHRSARERPTGYRRYGHSVPYTCICSFGCWLMAGADLFREKNIATWLLMAGLL
jgi:hypothetical protein